MEPKNVNAQIYFCFKTTTTLNKLHEIADQSVDSVYSEAKELKLDVTGPIQFIYFNCSSDRDKPFQLFIGLPVKEMLPLQNSLFSYYESDAFTCYTHIHPGDISVIGETYAGLYQELYKNGIQPGNQIREVYTKFVDVVSSENITEIQIGIEEA